MTITQDLLKPSSECFSAIHALLGLLLVALGLPALAAPAPVGRLWRAFPRSVWPGRLLSVVALAWSSLWLMAMPLGPLVFLRRALPVLFLVAVVAVWFLCDELLSCRAVGGLLVLVPTVMLSSAQWHPSPLRYVALVVAYLFAVAGMFLVAQPYHLRDVLFWCAASPARTRLGGAILALLGLALLTAASAPSPAPATVVLECGDLRAEVAPAWAGRLMFFGRKDGRNVLWTNPDAASAPPDANGNPVWKNVGGEKTWVGSQKKGWRGFVGQAEGSVWPPPAWFDSEPLRVVSADTTNVILRSDAHACGDWVVALERCLTLWPDRLVLRQRLLPEAVGAAGPDPLPDDIRRLWSITQVPRPEFVLLRPCGAARHVEEEGVPAPVPCGTAGWKRIDIASMTRVGKMAADGDALVAPLADGTGWLQIEQTAPSRFLEAIVAPGRAMVYASSPEYTPSPYAELEFAAYGPDAEQTLVLTLHGIRDFVP